MKEFIKAKNNNIQEEDRLSLLYGQLPSELSENQLRILEEGLKTSFESKKDFTKDQFKYAIPFHSIKEVLEGNSVNKTTDVLAGLTGMNIPMGLAMGFAEAGETIKKYRELLKIRKEIRNREKAVNS